MNIKLNDGRVLQGASSFEDSQEFANHFNITLQEAEQIQAKINAETLSKKALKFLEETVTKKSTASSDALRAVLMQKGAICNDYLKSVAAGSPNLLIASALENEASERGITAKQLALLVAYKASTTAAAAATTSGLYTTAIDAIESAGTLQEQKTAYEKHLANAQQMADQKFLEHDIGYECLKIAMFAGGGLAKPPREAVSAAIGFEVTQEQVDAGFATLQKTQLLSEI